MRDNIHKPAYATYLRCAERSDVGVRDIFTTESDKAQER